MKRKEQLTVLGRGIVRRWVLFIFPVLLLLVAFEVRAARGPHWLSENLDPTYPYLLNSLNIANLHRPFHTDHPGTPVQTAGGIFIYLSNPFLGEQGRAREVLGNPEHYARRISSLFIFLYALALAASGFIVFAAARSTALALLFQATPFVSATTIVALTGVRPEPLLAALSLIMAALALLMLRYDASTFARRYALAFGMVLGLGVACKINFAPLAIIPLMLLPRIRPRVEFCVAAFVSFIFFIAPILTPTHLRAALGFFSRIVTHTGRYGAGERGFADPQKLFDSALKLIAGDWLFFAILGACLVALAWIGFKRKAEQNAERPVRMTGKILLASIAAGLAQFLLVAKHPSAHYLTPALGLAGLHLVLLVESVNLWSKPSRTLRRSALASLLLALAFVQALELRAVHRRFVESAREQMAAHDMAESLRSNGQVVSYYSASSLPYALRFGTDYSNNFYGPLLDEMYPRQIFWSPWTQSFSNFTGPLDASQVKSALGQSFVMHGYSFADSDFRVFLPEKPLPEGLTLEEIYRGGQDRPGIYDGEALYHANLQPTY